MTLDIALFYGPTPLQRRAGITRVFKGSHSFTCHPRLKWAILAFAFLAEGGLHLPTPEGWKAELASALPWWVNSLLSTATWRKLELLTAQTVTPHRATGNVELTAFLAESCDATESPSSAATQAISGVVESIICVLFEISCDFEQCTNFDNRLKFDQVKAHCKVALFYMDTAWA